ncbi:hypothetical protein HDU93_006852 [Gonapodya sp. JEL0774]|nr:hypothetical protein HDU93_006852 [Gonapodya sp. JEL0774]
MQLTQRSLVFLLTLLVILAIATRTSRAADLDEDDDDDFYYTPPTPASSSLFGNLFSFLLPSSAPSSSSSGSPRFGTPVTQDWRYDVAAILVFLIYGVSWWFGKNKNLAFASEWLRVTDPVWTSNFAEVGDGKDHKLLVESGREYLFWASGRKSVTSVLGRIKMLPRHDIFMNFVYEYFYPQFDTLELDIVLAEDTGDSFVFSVMANKIAAKANDRFDLTFTRIRTHPTVNPAVYTIQTESGEYTDVLFRDDGVKEFFKLIDDQDGPGGLWLEELTLSDLPKERPSEPTSFESSTPRMRAVFRLPRSLVSGRPKNKSAEIDRQICVKQIEFFLECVDKWSNEGRAPLLTTEQTRNKVKKARDTAFQEVAKKNEDKRKEELSKTKVFNKRAEEERLAQLPLEER